MQTGAANCFRSWGDEPAAPWLLPRACSFISPKEKWRNLPGISPHPRPSSIGSSSGFACASNAGQENGRAARQGRRSAEVRAAARTDFFVRCGWKPEEIHSTIHAAADLDGSRSSCVSSPKSPRRTSSRGARGRPSVSSPGSDSPETLNLEGAAFCRGARLHPIFLKPRCEIRLQLPRGRATAALGRAERLHLRFCQL